MDKRQFLKTFSLGAIGTSMAFNTFESLMAAADAFPVEELARDEDFWKQIRSLYRLKEDYINLENGYYCFVPEPTLAAFMSHVKEVNFQGSWYMRQKQWEDRKMIYDGVAQLMACLPEEVAITRNTTESLNTVISGYPWQSGDEAIMAEQDYSSMLKMFQLAKDRHGILPKVLSVPNHPYNDDEIVQLYQEAITERTKMIMVCHMINITGQILPIQKIADMAHEQGVEVMVDAAHTIGHIDFAIPDLHADYLGSSLHKWLSVPLGAGLLWVKKEHIRKIWPLLAPYEYDVKDGTIQRLSHLGTHPVHTHLSILNAIEFQNTIGIQRKEARLRYLQRYWTQQLRDHPKIILNTPVDPKRSCAIANAGIKGMPAATLAKRLLEEYKIWTVAIDYAGVQGCRITPNVYTSTQELDVFVAALDTLAG